MKFFLNALALASCLGLPHSGRAQEESLELIEQVARTNPVETRLGATKAGMKMEESEVGPMNVFSRIQALDALTGKAGIDWKAVYKEMVMEVDSSAYTDLNGSVPFLLGARIADGMFAVRNRDREALSSAADDIRDFARKLGVSEGDLKDAEEARASASDGKWMHVITQLGFIQMRVIEQLRKAQPDQRRLIILGGWIQAARITGRGIGTAKISEKTKLEPGYFDPSYTLRDPLLTDALIDTVGKLGPKAQSTPNVKVMKVHLPKVKKIVDIPINPKDPAARISKEKIEELIFMATEVLTAAVAKPVAGAPETSPKAPVLPKQNPWGWIMSLGVAIILVSAIIYRKSGN